MSRIVVEVNEDSYSVVEDGTGLCHSKSRNVSLRIAAALRIRDALNYVTKQHDDVAQQCGKGPVGTWRRCYREGEHKETHSGALVATYPDGRNRCVCQFCMIAREEQQP